MTRVEIESKLNESRNRLLALYSDLSGDQLHRPLAKSESDPNNLWTALDHFGHLALVERNFVEMIRRYLSGHQNPVGLLPDETGATRTRELIMVGIHASTDRYQLGHRNDSFSMVVALTTDARSLTL
jgi:hypothetical protein